MAEARGLNSDEAAGSADAAPQRPPQRTAAAAAAVRAIADQESGDESDDEGGGEPTAGPAAGRMGDGGEEHREEGTPASRREALWLARCALAADMSDVSAAFPGVERRSAKETELSRPHPFRAKANRLRGLLFLRGAAVERRGRHRHRRRRHRRAIRLRHRHAHERDAAAGGAVPDVRAQVRARSRRTAAGAARANGGAGRRGAARESASGARRRAPRW